MKLTSRNTSRKANILWTLNKDFVLKIRWRQIPEWQEYFYSFNKKTRTFPSHIINVHLSWESDKNKGKQLRSLTYGIEAVPEMRSPYKSVVTYVLLNQNGRTQTPASTKGSLSWCTLMHSGKQETRKETQAFLESLKGWKWYCSTPVDIVDAGVTRQVHDCQHWIRCKCC